MAVTRDFDAMLAEKAGIRPTFKVGGEEFTLKAKLAYRKWNQLMALMRADDTDPHEATQQFFNAVLIKADRPRFAELLDRLGDDEDEDDVVGLDQMDAITDWVMEHFTGKQRPNSDSSSAGASTTGPSANVVSLNARSTAS